MEVGIRNGVDFMTHKLQTWKIINRQVFFRGASNKLAPASGAGQSLDAYFKKISL
jgi:hypothetical protein